MNLLSLIMVRLTGNKISKISRQVGFFGIFWILQIIFQAFNNIPNLRYVFLDKNNLNSIEPNTLQQFKMLEIVDLSYNNIGELAAGTFSNMEHLMQLNLEGDAIAECK